MQEFVRNQFHYRLLQCQKKKQMMMKDDQLKTPSIPLTMFVASIYVLSGVTQPLIMSLIKDAGIADPRAQLYMLFYYFGPASVALSVKIWPSPTHLGRTSLIAIFDLAAQAMNYTGSISGWTDHLCHHIFKCDSVDSPVFIPLVETQAIQVSVARCHRCIRRSWHHGFAIHFIG
jgi:hypothetical protein